MKVKKLLAAIAILFTAIAGYAQVGPQQILFTNASVFDGFAPGLIEGANVLVEGNVITQVSTGTIDAPNAKVIDATGKAKSVRLESLTVGNIGSI